MNFETGRVIERLRVPKPARTISLPAGCGFRPPGPDRARIRAKACERAPETYAAMSDGKTVIGAALHYDGR